MAEHYEKLRRDGALPATYEVVYGHAWKVPPKKLADGRQVIGFDRDERMTRGVFVTGTDTGVGKTVAACALHPCAARARRARGADEARSPPARRDTTASTPTTTASR